MGLLFSKFNSNILIKKKTKKVQKKAEKRISKLKKWRLVIRENLENNNNIIISIRMSQNKINNNDISLYK
jgi:hypothetical protein